MREPSKRELDLVVEEDGHVGVVLSPQGSKAPQQAPTPVAAPAAAAASPSAAPAEPESQTPAKPSVADLRAPSGRHVGLVVSEDGHVDMNLTREGEDAGGQSDAPAPEPVATPAKSAPPAADADPMSPTTQAVGDIVDEAVAEVVAAA